MENLLLGLVLSAIDGVLAQVRKKERRMGRLREWRKQKDAMSEAGQRIEVFRLVRQTSLKKLAIQTHPVAGYAR